MNYSRAQAFARTVADRLKNADNTLSSLTNGRFIQRYVDGDAATSDGVDVYDYYNGRVNSTSTAQADATNLLTTLYDNAFISGNAAGSFTYNIRLGDVIGGFFDLDKDVMLNESLYINLYLNNACVAALTTGAGAITTAAKDYTTTAFFIKVAYQQSNPINMSIKAAINAPEGLIIPFPYISNFSFNDASSASVHQVSISLRIYNMIGNKLRRIYLIPSSLNATAAQLQAGKSLLNSA
jgi:hypothetical protein